MSTEPLDRVSAQVRATRAPAIAELAALVQSVRRSGADLVDLGQAVPHYGPPASALARLHDRLGEASVHRYTPDEGLESLRIKWARVLKERLGLDVDPASELLITAGGNQAYLMTAMALLAPGEGMGLLSPWYFNHAMAVEMIGGRLVEIPLSAEAGYQPDADAIAALAERERLKAVTVVTPNNPTGAIVEPERLVALAERLAAIGVFLIVDETYAFFAPPDRPHLSAGSIEQRPRWVITLASFSKTFGVTGWRVGYVAAAPGVIRQMLKIQDTMVICASHPGQLLVELCLDGVDEWIAARRAEMARRAGAVRSREERFRPWRLRSAGPFFAYLDGPRTGIETVRALLDGGVIAVPGDSFGTGQGKSLRLALGGVDETRLGEGLDRVAAVLGAR